MQRQTEPNSAFRKGPFDRLSKFSKSENVLKTAGLKVPGRFFRPPLTRSLSSAQNFRTDDRLRNFSVFLLFSEIKHREAKINRHSSYLSINAARITLFLISRPVLEPNGTGSRFFHKND